ncbi:disks large 1 tumor suppressor protein-like [Copidosoma floridanum]|uniref:disks large 1 tumor suppressor protein-like n=1 Tax=Copidosoma floridanum TaxID=29053 RepID=UPI0006C9A012|nr:disks large 1 tumor suppressor protein-like [Copidosoma floridanum]
MQPKVSCYQPRIEIHRALELLSDYHARLTKIQEKQLIIEIERLIRIFKSRFFQALIDIQEFYAISLLDGITKECVNFSASHPQVSESEDITESVNNTSEPRTPYNEEVKDVWEKKQITLARGKTGFGFSIAGGTDSQHFPEDNFIYVTKIILGGAAAFDGQLQVHDIIEKVNETSLVNVTHLTAANTLKQSHNIVKLSIRRRKHLALKSKIELSKKMNSFGFSIAGGIGNQHTPGDNGIYITKIMNGGAAELDGRLKVGFKVTAIENLQGYRDFENVTHEEAVEAIMSTKNDIILHILSLEVDRQPTLKCSKNQSSLDGIFYQLLSEDQTFDARSTRNDPATKCQSLYTMQPSEIVKPIEAKVDLDHKISSQNTQRPNESVPTPQWPCSV